MTRDEILNMPAGREMDALIAEKVMGFYFNTYGKSFTGKKYPGWHNLNQLLHYSTDIAAALEVMEKMANKPGASWCIETHYYKDGTVMYWVIYKPYKNATFAHVYEDKSLPFAISKVALLAVMEVA